MISFLILTPRPSMMHREEPTLIQKRRHILTRQEAKVLELISKINNGKELRKMMASTIIITKIEEERNINTAIEMSKEDVPSIGRNKIGITSNIAPSQKTT